ncbi:phospho-sugar mutase [Jatrophihabitans endophyticus]|uniref:phospho-sugar mutase n=1 Tax=Jatrophihabitans endophyticus TaxID=1206085 RepID=UPI001A06AFBE|nr:phospho-sugar mutase [Jatrophihabitans endophyticus]MBE7187254.1 phospho-sugar mutase [Jatrophihabitans endophyticus]
MTLRGQARAWIADEVDPEAAQELQALLDHDADDELADRFAAPLTFGTAGLRGPLRAGPNGMNRAVVRRAAAGVATWLRDHDRTGAVVVLGHDARHGSREFAHDSAAVFAAAGFDARVLPGPLPTPVLAYAVQRLDAAAGVMVTASHNPAQDNGYKVYAGDGAQIVPPADTEIEAAIHAAGATADIALDDSYTVLDDSLVSDYVRDVVGLVTDGPRELRIVHTAMHGVGARTMAAVFAAAGFADVHPVPEQQQPDPDFPTVAFPNPEEPGALDLALELARAQEADVVIANDPDADRCAVAVPSPDGWRMLRGDEVGVLLADALMRRGVRGTYATTVVSSSLLGAMARRSGVGYAETLTGFKWISRAADDLVFGYEEALGYAVAPDLVRDKDGISAALLVAELAADLEATGSSLLDRLDNLARVYGRYATDQVSIRVDDLSVITDLMRRLRDDPPAQLAGHDVEVEDLLPRTDAVRWRWASGRVVVRPSGTEPKLKAYLEVVEPSGSAALAATALTRLRGEVEALLAR